jgi:hypothetical protein
MPVPESKTVKAKFEALECFSPSGTNGNPPQGASDSGWLREGSEDENRTRRLGMREGKHSLRALSADSSLAKIAGDSCELT